MAPPIGPLPSALAARYQVIGTIGQGSFGLVVRAQDLELSRVVALKLLEETGDAATLSRFVREAASLARLKHPHVVTVYSHGIEAGHPYLVMEYLEGKSLLAPPPGLDPLAAMLAVGGALAEVHALGLVHRDVKPANIFLTAEGRPVLLDFGLVFVPAATRITLPNLVVGTLAFLSPEVLQGANPDAASDWYAWAATLFWLYERRTHRTTEALLASARGAPTPAIEFQAAGVPARVRELLRAMLDGPPAERVSDLPALQAFLEAERRASRPAPVRVAVPGTGALRPAPGREAAGGGRAALGALTAVGLCLGLLAGGPAPAPGRAGVTPTLPAQAGEHVPLPVPDLHLALSPGEIGATFGLPPPALVAGWLADTVLASRELSRQAGARAAEVATVARDHQNPPGLAIEHAGLWMMAMGGLQPFVEGLLVLPGTRDPLAAWAGGAVGAFRRMLASAALAVRTDPERADLAVALVREPAIRFCAIGWLAYPDCPPEGCVGGPAALPGLAYLDGLAIRLSGEGRRYGGQGQERLMRAAAARLAVASEPDPDRPRAMRPVLAVLDRVALLDLLGDRGPVLDLWLARGAAVLALAPRAFSMKAVGSVLRAVEAVGPARLAEPDLAPTAAWIEGLRPNVAADRASLPVLERYDRLRAAAQSPRKPE